MPCCVSLLRCQVAAGAQVILTQPPLDWPAFELWMEDARRRGLHTAARLLIGFPCLSSASNAGFWLALCNAGNNAEVRRGACAAASSQCAVGQKWRRVYQGGEVAVTSLIQSAAEHATQHGCQLKPLPAGYTCD